MLKPRTMSQTTEPPIDEPTLESVAPEWAKLSSLLAELTTRQETIGAKISELAKLGQGSVNFAQDNAHAIADAAAQEGKPPRMIGPSKKVAGLLGEYAPAPVPAPRPLFHEPKVSKELRELAAESAAVQEAIKLLHPQLKKAHLEGSARLCALLVPEYKKIATRICAALVELGSSDIEHREFMKKHRNAARSTLRPVHATGSLGDPDDPQSELRRLLQWAAECGHFDLDDLPPNWGGRGHRGEIRSWPTT